MPPIAAHALPSPLPRCDPRSNAHLPWLHAPMPRSALGGMRDTHHGSLPNIDTKYRHFVAATFLIRQLHPSCLIRQVRARRTRRTHTHTHASGMHTAVPHTHTRALLMAPRLLHCHTRFLLCGPMCAVRFCAFCALRRFSTCVITMSTQPDASAPPGESRAIPEARAYARAHI